MKRRLTRSVRNAGFTLIELMAVVVILGMLATVVTIGITGQVKKARQNTAVTQIAQLEQAVSAFHLDCGFYPPSLEALVNPASSTRPCRGYNPDGYLNKKQIPLDPWDNAYNFAVPGIHNTTSYDLWSNGPDGEEGNDDDVKSWEEAKP